MLYREKHFHEGKAQGQVSTRTSFVEAHPEEVQGGELSGQGKLGVEHRSHRDEEARELHLPGCTVQRRGQTRTSRSTTLQISARKCLERLRTQSLARKREPRILD